MDVRPTLVSQRGVRQAADGEIRGSGAGGELQAATVEVGRAGRRGRERRHARIQGTLIEIEISVSGEGVESEGAITRLDHRAARARIQRGV